MTIRERRIPNLRWLIIGMLFISTVINYIDRQTLSILARTIQDDLGMSDISYARIVQAFLLAYTVTFIFAGRITDWLGTRVSLAVFITWWSIANMLTALSRSAFSLGAFRFLLGVGEPGNYTAAPKAVSEWFPPRERGLAVGIYTTGATVGATVAPPIIALLATSYGWRATFVFTGTLGLLWVVPWLWLYRPPRQHPRITDQELAQVEAETTAPTNAAGKIADAPEESEAKRWAGLLRRSETWLLLTSRVLTDPVWYFYLFWFPKYLSDARGLSLAELGKVAWVVYLAADIGSIIGGWASGAMIKRGVNILSARKRVMFASACLLPLSPLIAFVPSLYLALAIASIAAFAHLAWQVTLGVMIVDLYPQRTVATVFGLIAAGSGLGGLISTGVVGRLVTDYSYVPVFALMGVLHPLALVLIWQVKARRGPHATEAYA
jgi:ACS family hexuronate transporter-like MFS transporter